MRQRKENSQDTLARLCDHALLDEGGQTANPCTKCDDPSVALAPSAPSRARTPL